MGFHLIGRSFAALMVAIGLSACAASEICLSNQHAVQVHFISYYTKKDTTIEKVSMYGLGRTDSIYSSEKLSEVFLPLSFDNDPGSTAFVLKTATASDTLLFNHQKELDFISGECGYVFQFSLDSMKSTDNTIDSISIVYPTIKYGEDVQNVELYIY